MTRDCWRALHAIPALLRAEVGLAEAGLARRFHLPVSDIRKAAAILCRQGHADRCWTGTEVYVVLPALPAEREVSAA